MERLLTMKMRKKIRLVWLLTLVSIFLSFNFLLFFWLCTIIIEAQQDSQDHSIEFNDYEESKEASADNEVDKEDDVGLAINCF